MKWIERDIHNAQHLPKFTKAVYETLDTLKTHEYAEELKSDQQLTWKDDDEISQISAQIYGVTDEGAD